MSPVWFSDPFPVPSLVWFPVLSATWFLSLWPSGSRSRRPCESRQVTMWSTSVLAPDIIGSRSRPPSGSPSRSRATGYTRLYLRVKSPAPSQSSSLGAAFAVMVPAPNASGFQSRPPSGFWSRSWATGHEWLHLRARSPAPLQFSSSGVALAVMVPAPNASGSRSCRPCESRQVPVRTTLVMDPDTSGSRSSPLSGSLPRSWVTGYARLHSRARSPVPSQSSSSGAALDVMFPAPDASGFRSRPPSGYPSRSRATGYARLHLRARSPAPSQSSSLGAAFDVMFPALDASGSWSSPPFGFRSLSRPLVMSSCTQGLGRLHLRSLPPLQNYGNLLLRSKQLNATST